MKLVTLIENIMEDVYKLKRVFVRDGEMWMELEDDKGHALYAKNCTLHIENKEENETAGH